MLHVRQYNEEVLFTESDITKVGSKEIEEFKVQAGRNPRKRIRLCAHHDVSDPVHEMLVIHARDAYVRPHRHQSRQESFHIIEGLAYVVLFTEDGQVDEIVRLGEHHSGESFFCRIPEGAYHSVLVASDWLVFHETTKGPFKREDSAFAPWSPEEEDIGATRRFLDHLWDKTGVEVDPNQAEIE